jgi:hypothetical protein
MRTGIDPGLTGIVLIPRGIDATPGRDGPARSRVDLAWSRELPIPTGIDATLHRHRCPSESGRPDQMRSRPDSDRDRCPKSSGRCQSDQGSTLFQWSRCLRRPNAPLTTRDRSRSNANRALACPADSATQRLWILFRRESANRHPRERRNSNVRPTLCMRPPFRGLAPRSSVPRIKIGRSELRPNRCVDAARPLQVHFRLERGEPLDQELQCR